MIWALHGMLGDAGDWEPFADSSWRCLNLWEEWPTGGFRESAAAFCETVREADEEPSLLGYSLGGRLALHALLAEPGLWRRAMIISAHPGLATAEARKERMFRDVEWVRMLKDKGWHEFLQLWNAQPVFGGGPGDGVSTTRCWRPGLERGFLEWSLGRQRDLRGALEKVTVPVLWLTGERDHRFTTLATEWVGDWPAADHRVVPGVGHRLPWEDAAAFRGILDRWMTVG